MGNQPATGKERQALIAAAIARANDAHNAAYFLESISISDGLISDRLESICRHSGFLEPGRLPIGAVRARLQQQNVVLRDDKLLSDLAIWVPQRNALVHGLVKPVFESGDNLWESRLAISETVSASGLELMKRVIAEAKWHRL